MRVALAIAATCLVAAQAPSPAGQGADGKTYFWMRIWPDFLVKYDVEADQVVKKIQNKNGIAYETVLSHDENELFIVTRQRSAIEVVSLEKMERTEEHYFEEEGYINRIDSVREVPGGTHWYIKLDRVKREPDHFVIEKAQWLYYDRTKWEIEERMGELPEPIRRGARISPDGKKWHVFGRDFTIVDPETLEEEGKIELSKPLYTGMGGLSVRGEDFFDGRNPDAYRMLYTMRDPVKTNRTLMGVLDLDLVELEVTNRREWGASPGATRFRMSKDRKIGIGTKRTGERRRQYDGEDPVSTLITVDMDTGKKLRETRVDLRNGLRLAAISPDAQKIYFAGRGHELVVFDAEHRRLKTIELDGETDGSILVVEE